MLTPVAAAWLYLDVSQMAKTLPDFTARIAALVHRFAPASATLAARFYREQRQAAGFTAPFTPRPADPPSLEQIGKTVSWATRDLWAIGTEVPPTSRPPIAQVATRPEVAPSPLGHVSTEAQPASITSPAPHTVDVPPLKHAGSESSAVSPTAPPVPRTVASVPREQEISDEERAALVQEIVAAARTNLTGAVEKLVLDVGRDTIINSVAADPKAKAWARVPEPGCCYFCAMLATRGAVYNEESVQFKTHDHCRCQPEPVFNAYEPTAQIREWQALWAETTRGVHGMKNMQKAWRKAFEANAESPTGSEPNTAPGGQPHD